MHQTLRDITIKIISTSYQNAKSFINVLVYLSVILRNIISEYMKDN